MTQRMGCVKFLFIVHHFTCAHIKLNDSSHHKWAMNCCQMMRASSFTVSAGSSGMSSMGGIGCGSGTPRLITTLCHCHQAGFLWGVWEFSTSRIEARPPGFQHSDRALYHGAGTHVPVVVRALLPGLGPRSEGITSVSFVRLYTVEL